MSASDSVTPGLYSDALVRQRLLLRGTRSPGLRRALIACEKIADFASATLAVAVALMIVGGARALGPIAAISAMGGVLAVLNLDGNYGQERGGSLLQIRETERILRASVRCSLLLTPILLGLATGIPKRAILLMPVPLGLALMVQKRWFFAALRRIDRLQNAGERVVVYGAGAAERRIVSALVRSVRLGLQPVAVIDDGPEAMDRTVMELGYRDRNSVPVYAAPITAKILEGFGCSALVVVRDGLRTEQIEAAVECARIVDARVVFVSDPNLDQNSWLDSMIVDGLMLSSEAKRRWTGLYDVSKRGLDVALSSITLIVLSPLLLLIALLIKLDSAGPVMFIQDRVGLNGNIFRIFKFRSMFQGSRKYEPSPTSSLDPRLTRVGRLLRQLSLDELPQLVNVIRGEMSLVGPRPEMPFIVQGYDAAQRTRLSVMPGITGLWQLSGDRAFPIHENLEYDIYYVRHRGLFMDVAILLHTVIFAMRGGI